MMKPLMLLGGAAIGFAVASGMTEEQRRSVRERARSLTTGERGRRLASAVTATTETVADAAVAKVETAADKVVAKVDPAHAGAATDAATGSSSTTPSTTSGKPRVDAAQGMQPTGPLGTV